MKTSTLIKTLLLAALTVTARPMLADGDRGGGEGRGNNIRFKGLPSHTTHPISHN